MTKKSLKVNIQKPFGNLYRNKHVLVLIKLLNGHFMLGKKVNFYPEGVYRLVGGGLNKDEDPKVGALRELKEETGIEADDLIQLCEIQIEATDEDYKIYKLVTFVFLYESIDDKFNASDDISGLIELTKDEFENLIHKYQGLQKDDWYKIDGVTIHSWQDYGKVYGPIHQYVFEEISEFKD